MKKKIFLLSTVFAIGFTYSSLNASTAKEAIDCEDIAFDYADYIYDKYKDGFKAGKAFTDALALCELAMK